MKKIGIFLFFVIITMSVYTINPWADHTPDSNNILILQSYSEDYKWTKDFQQGIVDSIFAAEMNINYQVEYMDTKRYHSDNYFEQLKNMYTSKYQDHNFDIIVAIDNNALEIALDLRKNLFKEVPIIAGGINNAKQYGVSKDVYIIEENVDYLKTVEYMTDLNSRIEKIYVINDQTITGRSITSEIKEGLKTNNGLKNIEVEFISSKTIDELRQWSTTLNETDGILYLVYFTDGEGSLLNYKEGISSVSQVSAIPIFTTWDFYLNVGSMGGFLTSPTLHGATVGDTIIDYFNGNSILALRDDLRDKDKKILDYQLYTKYRGYFEKKPMNVYWINEPESYLKKNKEIIMVFSTIIIVLVIIVLLAFQHIQTQDKISKKDKSLLNIQNELIYTLGDVIETRSGETANHVKRVAEISEYIAIKSGHKEIAEMLKIAAPLHDLGKIGIRESVLNKPESLTDEEYDIIKEHTNIGYEILKNKKSEILNIASIIAHEHQEHWDGSGYPDGLKGEEISIYGRIVAIADVYDALRSDRVYKASWSVEKTMHYFKQQSGRMFEPRLVNVILTNVIELENIRNKSLSGEQ